ncbi:hypothetical protein KC19_4G246900 [Ceratodon purpureus]|uniref:Uncharacterized protein n=1 Tax=Ceratodon purpureus TaxID=3225 RepID=A0A8T0IES3_CERPU|nr:hypothetical protein KC19_4G246900 [Ceratodon purpureus]
MRSSSSKIAHQMLQNHTPNTLLRNPQIQHVKPTHALQSNASKSRPGVSSFINNSLHLVLPGDGMEAAFVGDHELGSKQGRTPTPTKTNYRDIC